MVIDSLIGFCRPAKSIRGMFLLGLSQLFDRRLTAKKSFFYQKHQVKLLDSKQYYPLHLNLIADKSQLEFDLYLFVFIEIPNGEAHPILG